jgi:hypothetical protein
MITPKTENYDCFFTQIALVHEDWTVVTPRLLLMKASILHLCHRVTDPRVMLRSSTMSKPTWRLECNRPRMVAWRYGLPSPGATLISINNPLFTLNPLLSSEMMDGRCFVYATAAQ